MFYTNELQREKKNIVLNVVLKKIHDLLVSLLFIKMQNSHVCDILVCLKYIYFLFNLCYLHVLLRTLAVECFWSM